MEWTENDIGYYGPAEEALLELTGMAGERALTYLNRYSRRVFWVIENGELYCLRKDMLDLTDLGDNQ